MAASLISGLIYTVRSQLKEPIPSFWNDQELLDHLNNGARDLWRMIVDLYEHHFLTVIDTPYIDAGASVIYQLPEDVHRVVLIEPRVVGTGTANPGLIFKPLPYTDPRFLNARGMAAQDPRDTVCYYTPYGEGGPVNPPTIKIAPTFTSAVNLTLAYNHTLPRFDEDDRNPIPGEADNALVAWCLAFARAKEREDNRPDPGWLAIYQTEKRNLQQQLAPRQSQEPQFVLGMFEGYEF